MPIYEYRCSEGHEFDAYESISSPTERICGQSPIIKRRALGPSTQKLDTIPCRALARRVMSLTNVNVDAVMKPGDVRYTPPLNYYLGRRRWGKKQDRARDDRKASKNPVTI